MNQVRSKSKDLKITFMNQALKVKRLENNLHESGTLKVKRLESQIIVKTFRARNQMMFKFGLPAKGIDM